MRAIHIHTCTYTYTYVYIHIHIHTYTYTYIYIGESRAAVDEARTVAESISKSLSAKSAAYDATCAELAQVKQEPKEASPKP